MSQDPKKRKIVEVIFHLIWCQICSSTIPNNLIFFNLISNCHQCLNLEVEEKDLQKRLQMPLGGILYPNLPAEPDQTIARVSIRLS
jgi:hypothetical protein